MNFLSKINKSIKGYEDDSEFLTDILININFLAYSNYEYENNEILIKIKSIRKGIIFNIKG